MDRILTQEIKHGCAVLDGSTGFVSINDNLNINNLNAFTVEAFVNTKTLASSSFVSKWTLGSATNNSFSLGLNDGNQGLMSLAIQTDTAIYIVVDTVSIPLNTWVHYSGTFDGLNLRLYKNGVLIGTTILPSTQAVKNTTKKLLIGKLREEDNLYSTNSSIDEVRIWDYARTAQQIKDNYNRVLKPQQGLVAYYKLDGNALDSSGNANHGTVNGGVSWSTSVSTTLEKSKALTTKLKQGSAVFDGGLTEITTGKPFNFDINDPFTVEFWLRPQDQSTKSMGCIIGKKHAAANSWNIRQSISNILIFELVGDYTNSQTEVTTVSSNPMTLNQWSHTSFVYEGSSRKMHVYINGVFVRTATYTGTQSFNNNIDLVIGKRQDDSTRSYLGSLADIRIWNYARTATQIAENYKKVLQPQAGLIAYYKLNGNALDSSGNGNNGTETNVGYSVDGYVPVGSVANINYGERIQGSSFFNRGFTTMTWETWCCVKEDKAATQTIIGLDSIGNYLAATTTINKPIAVLRINNTHTQIYGTTTIRLGVWYHMAMSYDGSNLRIYINGIEEGKIAATGPLDTFGNPILIGKFRNVDNLSAFAGTVSMVRVWSKALTQKEILDNMYKVLPAGTTSLLEQWTLNGNALGTNGNNGTATGGVTFVPDAPTGVADVSSAVEKEKLLVSRDKQPYMFKFNGVTNWAKLNYINIDTGDFTLNIVCSFYQMKAGTIFTQEGTSTNLGRLRIATGGDNKLSLVMQDKNGGGFFALYSINALIPNAMYYISVVREGDVIKLILNGEIQATRSSMLTSSSIKSDNPPVISATNTDTTTQNVYLNLAQVKAWSRALTGNEIINNSNTGVIANYVANANGALINLMDYNNAILYNIPQLLPSTAPVGQRSGLSFDGSTNKVTISAQTLTDFTFTTWFNKTSSKTVSFLSNNTTNILGLNSSNLLTFNALASNISYSIHKTWNYLVVTREAGVVKASLNNGSFITVGTDNTSITINELGNSFDGVLSAITLFNTANAGYKPYIYLSSATPNLVEQWKLNEGAGSVVYGTKGNNGTITGAATWTTPSLMNYVGKQLSLNGTSQYVNTELSLSGSYTKECWINPSSIAGTDNILSGGNTGFQLVDGKLSGGHNGNYQQVSDTVTIAGHTHVAITYNDTTKLLSLYKNGLLIATATSASYTASVQQIGAFGSANLFHGKLDDVRVWNVARTQTQIQADMNRTLGRKPGLVLNMGFESDYYDASGYGNHGTPVGNPVLEVTDNDKLLLNAPIN
jgi:hypothetical protein